MKTLFAYLLGAVIAAPLAMLFATPITFLMAVKKTLFWPGAAGFVAALLAYYAVNVTFQWLEANFHWYSYLLCMTPIFMNEGQRVGRASRDSVGVEKANATGVFLGSCYSLLSHFQ